jgi:ABC transporter substrate binding protein
MQLLALVILILSAAGGWQSAVAQPARQIYRVGLLAVGADLTDQSPFGAGLIRGFACNGFVLGWNLTFDRCAGHGQVERLPIVTQGYPITRGYPAALAAKHKPPAIFEYDFLVREGGLMSYGLDIAEMFDRAAGLAVRIQKGADPGRLPIEEPSRSVLAINLKTAEKIGLTVSPSLVARAACDRMTGAGITCSPETMPRSR